MLHRLQELYARFGKRRLAVAIVTGILLVLGAYYVFGRDSETQELEAPLLPQVRVEAVSKLGSVDQFSAVGTVSAVSEARLQTEAAGRVVSVTTEIGKRVAAGQVLAVIENSRERAALLQAEGNYEAARAGAEQGDSGARDAKNALATAEDTGMAAVRNAYTAANGALINSIDQFFASPNGQIPGLRVDGNAASLNAERVAYQQLMPEWQQRTRTLANDSDAILKALDDAESNIVRISAFLEQFIAITNKARASEQVNGVSVNSLTPGLLAELERLNATLRSIQSARSGIVTAKEAVVRSQIGGTSSQVSLANAQVKVALGNLRAAQVAYEKTLVRTPISGVVNALYLKAGQYVGMSTQAAIVANNNGLEIRTAVSQTEADTLKIGNSVQIDDTATGTITAIAGAVDPTTGKIAVKVSVDDATTLQNGSTVTITFVKQNTSTEAPISIPLSALKMTGSGPVTFSVSEDDTLVAIPVTLGQISGDSVVVTEGITLDSKIVVDARGLKEGQKVTVAK